MMPYNKAMSSVIRQRPDFHSMTSSEVLDEFVAMSILDKTADNAVLGSQRAKKPNLALKAKVIVEEEEEEEDEESNPEDTKYDYQEPCAHDNFILYPRDCPPHLPLLPLIPQ